MEVDIAWFAVTMLGLTCVAALYFAWH